MTKYDEVLNYLYTQLPMFQRVGNDAFRKDLTNTLRLCEYLSRPQHRFKSVHIAGTNGKGSSSHMVASVLQQAGYKVGLYTSPHLKDFSERIRLNGKTIEQQYVIEFVNRIKPIIQEVSPSFFEITVAMAFDYFADQQVDIAIIEVGMGGRLDSTNVLLPEVSLITNISMDHSQWLGDTLEKIATEKAGIIKDHIPVVISEKQEEIAEVFIQKASGHQASCQFASDNYQVVDKDGRLLIKHKGEDIFTFKPDLRGTYQKRNLPGVLMVLELLKLKGFQLNTSDLIEGLENVIQNTGLKGRWQIIQRSPKVICDVGHNEAGVDLIVEQLSHEKFEKLHMIWGTVEDKEIDSVLARLPKTANYFFCQADIPRALNATELMHKASKFGLSGRVVSNVNDALKTALSQAKKNDLIFVGGSTFVVAEVDSL